MEIGSAAPLLVPVAADDPNTRREEEVEDQGMEIFRASNGAARRFDSRMLTALAENGETMRRRDVIVRPPPIELVDYPDIFERAWGWDSLLPCNLATPLPLYKIYLRKYYIRNHQREAADDLNGDDHGNGLLATLADSCIKMENHLMFMWNHRGKSFTINSDADEVPLLSENITKRAREMSHVPVSEFPAAAIALKCITKEAELMCQCIISGSCAVSSNVSNGIRQCALSFMTYKKDYVPAAAIMMGIMKEAELVIKLLRGVEMKNEGNLGYTDIVRHRTMLMMLEMCDECSAVAEPTVVEITGDLKFIESEDKLAENGNQEDRGNVNENKKSKEKLTRDDANERNMQEENKNGNEKLGRNILDVDKVKPYTKNPNEKLGRNSLEDKVKPDTKVESSQVHDENKNPNVLGRNSLKVDKAGTEKQPNLVGSRKEGHNSTSMEKIEHVLKHQSSGKAGRHRKDAFSLKPGASVEQKANEQ